MGVLRGWATAASGPYAENRTILKLPQATATQVSLVTSESICKKARDAYQAFFAGQGGSAFSGRVYVVKVGTAYVVVDPAHHYGDSRTYTSAVFDSRYRHLSTF